MEMPALDHTVLYEAFIASFCLASLSDGKMTMPEFSVLLKNLNSDHGFPEIPVSQTEKDVSDFSSLLEDNFQNGKTIALSRIHKVKGHPEAVHLIKNIAVATFMVDDAEPVENRNIMHEIVHALGADGS